MINAFRRFGFAVLLAWLTFVGMAGAGCVIFEYPRAIPTEGGLVSLDAVDEILADPDLTEDQKREQLRTLGITDESLLNFLLNQG
jgi:hypothetical protein